MELCVHLPLSRGNTRVKYIIGTQIGPQTPPVPECEQEGGCLVYTFEWELPHPLALDQ